MRSTLSLVVSVLFFVSPGFAQTDWFPPELQEGAARQMIERFTRAGIELPNSEEDQLERARGLIGKLVTRIDTWGLEGVVQNAPTLAKIDLPEFSNRILSALALYGACSMPLDPDLVNTAEEKSVVVLGEMSVAVVSAFLRHQYFAGGGTEKELADSLGSEAMNRLFYEIQAIQDTRSYIATECGPTFEALWKN